MEQRRGGINTSNRMRIELNPKHRHKLFLRYAFCLVHILKNPHKCGYWSGTHEALQSRYGSCSIKKIELHDFGTCLHPKGTESLWFKQPNMVENNLKTVLNKKFDDDVEHGFAPGVEMFILDVDTLREQAEKAIKHQTCHDD